MLPFPCACHPFALCVTISTIYPAPNLLRRGEAFRGGFPMPDGQIKAQTLKGFRDFLPQQMVLRQHVISTLRRVFEQHGFEPLETPVLEYAETLEGKYGDDERLLYRFTDQGDRRVGMRYDLTVPLARVVGQYVNTLAFPFKRYQIQPV